ncbi:MAG: DMT family transporter [Gemmobacter sp.]|nr:DMT family transporter [Gemmobacter sp.]
MRESLKGAALMVLAMAGFALEDMLIKRLSTSLPSSQTLLMIGLGGMAVFAAAVRAKGQRLAPRAVFTPAVLLRNLGEAIGMLGFITALTLVPLSVASAILQGLPLVATLGAVLFLRETVGWRRWSAIAVGFVGMLIIVRPLGAGFDPAALFAVLGVAGLAVRDLATRRIVGAVSSIQLSFWGFASALPAAAVLALFGGDPRIPAPAEWAQVAAILVMSVTAYLAMTAASRVGDVSFIAPFRYSRLVFALILGWLVFGERLDAPMLIGSALIVGSGLYTFFRERALSTRRIKR